MEIYSIDGSSNYSEPAYVGVDTGLYSVYGAVTLSVSGGVGGAQLLLKDSEERIVDVATTGPEGSYTLPNLENGNYTIEVSHPSHEIQNPLRSVTVIDQNVEENFTATPVSTLFLLFDLTEVRVGDTVLVPWAYRNIDNSANVNIELNRGSGWQTIAANVSILQGQIEWTIDAPTAVSAVLKVSLSDDSSVHDEHTLSIEPPICEGDFEPDGDVDGSDLAVFAADFGRTDCVTPPPCEGDFDGDGDVDGSDLALFAADFGRTDCP